MDLSTPGKSSEMIPNTSLGASEDPLISEYEYGRVVPVSVDASLCKYCRKLAVDVLAEPAAFSTGWETIRSEYFSLSYLKVHQDGTVQSLLQSAKGDCMLCTLMAQQLRIMDGYPGLYHVYHIFVLIQGPKKCEFLLGLGDVLRFLRDIRHWDSRPITFTFFRRNGFDTNWSNLNKHLMFGNGEWPPLLTWPNQFPGSGEAIHRAKRWLSECLNDHKSCLRPNTVLPKRVLDLGLSETPATAALYVTKGEVAPYATLSYSWGTALPLKTTKFNINQHCTGIPVDAFPKTLRDAIFIAKCLSFRYLWVDALCIIQGDDVDWAEQSAAMTEIYQGSTLNISALSSFDCDYGILNRLPDHGFRIGTYFHPDNSEEHGDIFVGISNNVLDLGEKHLSSRGWAFQERLVSVASLHYTDEGMIWECASGIALEHDQGYRQFELKSEWKYLTHGRLQDRANRPSWSQTKNSSEDHYDFWDRWVSEFSERNLTQNEDKLPAMAGIAKFYANKFQLTYAAGLWRENILSGLLWQRHHKTTALTRFREYVAPSWSWASVKGPLKYHNTKVSLSNSGIDLMILGIEIEEDQPGTFGRIRHGKIDAEGFLQAVVVDGSTIVDGVVANANVTCILDEHVASKDRYYACWCLRVGTYNASGRESTVFLLLEKEDPHENRFCRVGVAETAVWGNTTYKPVQTDVFVSGQRSRFTLV